MMIEILPSYTAGPLLGARMRPPHDDDTAGKKESRAMADVYLILSLIQWPIRVRAFGLHKIDAGYKRVVPRIRL